MEKPLQQEPGSCESYLTNQPKYKNSPSHLGSLYVSLTLFPIQQSQCCAYLLQIHETIETINQLKTQREFMLSFARDPQGFINDWLQSQCRDLKVKAFLVWKVDPVTCFPHYN